MAAAAPTRPAAAPWSPGARTAAGPARARPRSRGIAPAATPAARIGITDGGAMARLVKIYDTTLRDGTQGEGVAFSMEDKVRLAQRLDQLGVHYIEGGWPGSNPKDMRFFRRILDVPLKHARVAAFGATRRPGTAAEADPSLQALVEAHTPVATIFGKSWPFHVTHALQTTLA